MPQEHLRNQQDPMPLPPKVRNAEPIIWGENQGLQLKRTCRGIHSSGFISQWWSTQPFRGCCRHGPNVLGYYFCRQQTPWSSCDTDFTSMHSARVVGLGRLPPRFQWMIWEITQEVPWEEWAECCGDEVKEAVEKLEMPTVWNTCRGKPPVMSTAGPKQGHVSCSLQGLRWGRTNHSHRTFYHCVP